MRNLKLSLSEKNYIICVDDEQAVLNQLAIQLGEACGDMCSIESAESAEEALALMEELTSEGGKDSSGDFRSSHAEHARRPVPGNCESTISSNEKDSSDRIRWTGFRDVCH